MRLICVVAVSLYVGWISYAVAAEPPPAPKAKIVPFSETLHGRAS